MLALVISETHTRAERAAGVVIAAGFRAVQLPAIFVNNTQLAEQEQHGCAGTNGHRLAMRNAYKMIAYASIAMCIFEDDVVLREGLSASEVQRYATTHMQSATSNGGVDVLWLGSSTTAKFMTNHAQCFSPRGAELLLNASEQCIFNYGWSIDRTIRNLCASKRLRCLDERKCFFTQDRINVKPYLHTTGAHHHYLGGLEGAQPQASQQLQQVEQASRVPPLPPLPLPSPPPVQPAPSSLPKGKHVSRLFA